MDRQRKPLLVTIDDTVILTKEVLTDRCLDPLFESFSYLPSPRIEQNFYFVQFSIDLKMPLLFLLFRFDRF